MAWNDPPSFDYQQISNSGRKFKHRYVLSDTNSKFGQSSPQFHQNRPLSNDNQFQHQSMAPMQQGHPQQPFHHNSPPTQLNAPQTIYNNNNDNGMMTSPPASIPFDMNKPYQGFEISQSQANSYAANDPNHNNFSNNQSMMFANQPQYQSPTPPPPPPPQMMSQQQQAFQPQ